VSHCEEKGHEQEQGLSSPGRQWWKIQARTQQGFILAAAITVGSIIWLYLCAQFKQYQYIGYTNDDAVYIQQAQECITTGRLTPRPSFLPGFSLIISPFLLLFPGNLEVLQWVSMGFMLSAGILFGMIARARSGVVGGFLVGMMSLYNPAALTVGPQILSDAAFTFLAALSFFLAEAYALRRSERWITVAIVVTLACLVRVAGITIFVSLLLGILCQKRWKDGMILAASFATLFLIFCRGYYTAYLATPASNPQSLLLPWVSAFPELLWRNFLGIPSTSGWAILVLIAILAIAGMYRQWRIRGLSWIFFFPPLYFLLQLLWPYIEARYFLPWWPIILLLAIVGLPPSLRNSPLILFPVLLPLMAGNLNALDCCRTEAPFVQRTFITYNWIRDTLKPPIRIMCLFDSKMKLLTGHTALPMKLLYEQPSELLVMACRNNAGYIVVQKYLPIPVNVAGHRPAPSRMDLWLDSSQLVEWVFGTNLEAVYRLKVDPALYIHAYSLYYNGSQMWNRGDSAGAKKAFGESLELVPDFPEAAISLATILLEEGNKKEGIAMLQEVVSRYPVSTDATINLSRALLLNGEKSRSFMLLHQALHYAEINSLRASKALLQKELSTYHAPEQR